MSRNGSWDNERRTFLTATEKAEQEKLGDLTNAMLATNVQFISHEHRRAMATENDSVSKADSRLTKNDKAPPTSKKNFDKSDDMSDLTKSVDSKSTTESKAKRYADSAVKEVAKQYNATIDNLNTELDDAAEEINEKYDVIAALKAELDCMKASFRKKRREISLVTFLEKINFRNTIQN